MVPVDHVHVRAPERTEEARGLDEKGLVVDHQVPIVQVREVEPGRAAVRDNRRDGDQGAVAGARFRHERNLVAGAQDGTRPGTGGSPYGVWSRTTMRAHGCPVLAVPRGPNN